LHGICEFSGHIFYAGSAGANEQDAGRPISHAFKAIDKDNKYLHGDVKALVERSCCNFRARVPRFLSGCLVHPDADLCVYVFMGIEGTRESTGLLARDGA
jgi:hypothetical protein